VREKNGLKKAYKIRRNTNNAATIKKISELSKLETIKKLLI